MMDNLCKSALYVWFVFERESALLFDINYKLNKPV